MSTEHKNYYPLRVDKKYGSAIVSDVDPCRPTYDSNSKQYELNEYGGHIIAESLPPGVAQQIVDAYNEKYAQQSFTPRESSTIQDQIEWITDRKIIVDKKELYIVDAIIENLIAIKRWNQNPLWSQLDIEKVIEDLLEPARNYIEERSSEEEANADPAIQNAEAALGMLQAFKENRNKPKIQRINPTVPPSSEAQMQDFFKIGELFDSIFTKEYVPKSDIELGIRNKLRNSLPTGMVGEDSRMLTANAIINAIDQMLKLRGL